MEAGLIIVSHIITERFSMLPLQLDNNSDEQSNDFPDGWMVFFIFSRLTNIFGAMLWATYFGHKLSILVEWILVKKKKTQSCMRKPRKVGIWDILKRT